jgi:hypothetical protein
MVYHVDLFPNYADSSAEMTSSVVEDLERLHELHSFLSFFSLSDSPHTRLSGFLFKLSPSRLYQVGLLSCFISFV